MKKFFYITVISIFVIFIQIICINGKTLFGVTPNLIIVLIVILNMYLNTYKSCIISFIIGLSLDLIYGTNIYALSYSITSVIIDLVNNENLNKDKLFIILLIVISTISFELINGINLSILNKVEVSYIYLIYQAIIVSIYNIVIGYILYNLFFVVFSKFQKKDRYYIGGVRN